MSDDSPLMDAVTANHAAAVKAIAEQGAQLAKDMIAAATVQLSDKALDTMSADNRAGILHKALQVSAETWQAVLQVEFQQRAMRAANGPLIATPQQRPFGM